MNQSRFFWGVVFVVFGGLLLLNNFDFLPFNVWQIFWPLIVILLGLWILWQTQYGGENLESESASIPLAEATEAKITFHHGAGELKVNGGAESNDLLAGSFTGGVNQSSNPSGERLDAILKVPTEGFPFMLAPWFWGSGNRIRWDVQLNSEVPISMEINSGASDTQLNLRETLVKELVIKTGASATTVTTPARAGYTYVKVEAGAASVKINVPEDVAAKVEVEGGLLGVDVDKNRFPKEGKYYQSPEYDSAANQLEIKVEAGAGSLFVG